MIITKIKIGVFFRWFSTRYHLRSSPVPHLRLERDDGTWPLGRRANCLPAKVWSKVVCQGYGSLQGFRALFNHHILKNLAASILISLIIHDLLLRWSNFRIFKWITHLQQQLNHFCKLSNKTNVLHLFFSLRSCTWPHRCCRS